MSSHPTFRKRLNDYSIILISIFILSILIRGVNPTFGSLVLYVVNDEVANIVLAHLKERYEQNPDKFFDVYGTEIGGIVLAKELQKSYGVTLNLQKIGTLIGDGRSLEVLLGVEDARFRRVWKPRNAQLTLQQV